MRETIFLSVFFGIMAFGANASGLSVTNDPVVEEPRCSYYIIHPDFISWKGECRVRNNLSDRDRSDVSDDVPVGKQGKPVGRDDDDPRDHDCGCGGDRDPSPVGDRTSKGNASANNGKGGNYDKTGHSDNGKGKGRDKK